MTSKWDERAKAIAEICKSFSKAEVAEEIVRAMQYAYSHGYKDGCCTHPYRGDRGH